VAEPLVTETLFLFDPTTGDVRHDVVQGVLAVPAVPAVIDSFVSDNGVIRAADRHVRRFTASCKAWRGVDEGLVRAFTARALEVIPSTGQWFPRFELLDLDDIQLALRVRPRPPLASSAKLWLMAGPVDRRAPRIKGPDLPALNALRAGARQAGADEALLTSAEGFVLESSQSNVLWWRDDVLCTVPADAPALPGITRELLLELAVADGHEVRAQWISPPDLDGVEVWLVNALHGLRPVTEFVGAAGGSPIRTAAATRAPAWRAKLAGSG
jgi:branched-subunit amino acid aminotransferase/4-amino-4-deoxychorismate lyase